MILIIGTIPPPIGGVTIHVSRLIEWLEKCNFPYYELLKVNDLLRFTKLIKIINFRAVHLHTSSPQLRLLLSIFCYIFRKKLIITYHGDLLRFKSIRNMFDLISVKLSTYPIVLNNKSYKIAKKYNKNSTIISAFLPPTSEKFLPKSLLKEIINLKSKHKRLFCTNAYDVSFDKDGNEIYGISELVRYFSQNKDIALIISDPSGNYREYLTKNEFIDESNILLISKVHSFYEVLKNCDVFIRNTTTDGDSISIREALFLHKEVYATDCVSRPKGCNLYKNLQDISLEKIRRPSKSTNKFINSNPIGDIIELYQKINNETNHTRH